MWLGGDNAGFIGSTILQHNNGKVFRSGEFVMGGAGSRRLAELMRFAFKPPAIKGKDLDAYMVTDFTRAARKALREHAYLCTDNGREKTDSEDGDALLVGVRGRLYYVGPDFSASAVSDGMFAVGCGMDFALGALYATPTLAPEKRLQLALEAAERYSDGVAGPFHVVSTGAKNRADAALMKAWKGMHAKKGSKR